MTEEELIYAWRNLISRYESISSQLMPLLQKFNNLEKEREALQEEIVKRGIVIEDAKVNE